MSALREDILTGDRSVLDALVHRIQAEGPILFEAFMDAALYGSPGGYYERMTSGIGRMGADYYTAPEASPAFSELLAGQVIECFDHLGPDGPLDLVELGGGTGAMALGMLEHLARARPDLYQRTTYWIVERSASLRHVQKRRLQAHDLEEKVQWAQRPESIRLGGVMGCVVANEFYDALPVRIVVRRGDRLLERRVGLTSDGTRLTWVDVEATDAALLAYATRYRLAPLDGAIAEAGIAACEWAKRIARVIGRGYHIVVDYGDRAERLYDPHARPHGTLMGYSRHRASEDPFARVGAQDLTAHVNFSAIEDAASEEGLRTVGFTTQDRFLVALGLAQRIAGLAGSSDPAAVEERVSMMSLIHPDGMGGIFRVLVQGKGASSDSLRGLRDPFAHSGEGAVHEEE